MSLTFTAKPTTSALPPLGTYQGKVAKIELTEPRLDNFNKDRHIAQLRFVLAVTEVVSVVNEDDEDDAYELIENGGEAWAYANAYAIDNEDVDAYRDGNTAVAHPIFGKKSTLRGWYESISGKTLSDGESANIDDLIDRDVMFTVEANENGNPTIKKINAYKKPRRRGRKRPEPEAFEGEILDEEDDEEGDF